MMNLDFSLKLKEEKVEFNLGLKIQKMIKIGQRNGQTGIIDFINRETS